MAEPETAAATLYEALVPSFLEFVHAGRDARDRVVVAPGCTPEREDSGGTHLPILARKAAARFSAEKRRALSAPLSIK